MSYKSCNIASIFLKIWPQQQGQALLQGPKCHAYQGDIIVGLHGLKDTHFSGAVDNSDDRTSAAIYPPY